MVIITIVTPAPDILIVQPNGIEIEKVVLSNFISSHKARFTGKFAAEDLVKNAVVPDFAKHFNTSGNGFSLATIATKIGFTTKAMINMVATKTQITCT